MEELRALPSRVDALEGQILQLRAEMNGGFAALREGDEEGRRHATVLYEEAQVHIGLIAEGHLETQQQVAALREEMNARFGHVDARFDRMDVQIGSAFNQMMSRLDDIDRRLASRRAKKR
ncbi:MAG: hypothetical protein AB7F99_02745 [Vicinamibacterales bacterium]